jgi:hypothetical protein
MGHRLARTAGVRARQGRERAGRRRRAQPRRAEDGQGSEREGEDAAHRKKFRKNNEKKFSSKIARG